MKRIVIVGGGITGLATAHALEKAEGPCRVRLVEAAPHLGGNLVTMHHNGFVLDGGPDSWVAQKPHATRLAEAVGLGDEIIGTRPDTRKVYVVWNKQLHAMPEGLVLGVPTSLRPFATSDLLGWDAKLRAGLDLIAPPRNLGPHEDESISAFVSRRLGQEIVDKIAGPLLGGIFAGCADSLSARACIPQLVEAEAKYGSLIRAMRARRASREAAADSPSARESSVFLSLQRGMGDLVLNVAHRLRDAEVSTSCVTRSLERLPDGDPRGRWALETSSGALHADHVALTLPAHAASTLVSGVDGELAAMLGEVEYASTATIFLAYKKFDVRHPLDAAGLLVPRAENRPIVACTFVSSKWEHRAPAGQILLRVFVGGAGNEQALERDDDELVTLAREQMRDLLQIERPPIFTKVFRFAKASPQPTVGHLERMARVQARIAEHRGLHVGGNGYVGTGISDSVKQGEEIAARILADGLAPP